MKPMPMNMTLEEQERWAYAEGNTALAEVLARADDAVREADDLRDELDKLTGA